MGIVLTNAAIFDGVSNGLRRGTNVFVQGDLIREVSDRPPGLADGDVIDCGGQTLMPGLIDAHIHAFAFTLNVREGDKPLSFLAGWATFVLRNMLDRGFTTVRDTGGADYGLYLALQRGYITGPRLYYCGHAISQTGGHIDLRDPHVHSAYDVECVSCGCAIFSGCGVVVDGVDAVRRIVRENLRRGSNFVKFAGSGGISSLSDALDSIQFSDEEVLAIVDEVERAGAYCTAHIHPDKALKRAIKLGVHCIEHGTLIEADTARMAAERGVYIVPTLAVIVALAKEGREMGYPPEALAKLDAVKDEAVARLQHMKDAGVKVGFGTDLLGRLERYQSTEFGIRKAIYSPYEILVQATSMNAEIVGAKGKLGVIQSGAYADLLLVRGDPLKDISVLERGGENLQFIMKGGAFHKRQS